MSHLSILVVEDEPAIAETLVYSLETEGYQVRHVETGAAALEAFAESPANFLVLDVGLPDMTGFDVCRELRKTSNVPILFLTARESEIDKVVGLEIGGDDYVVKPFSPRELTARIGAILRRSGGERAANSISHEALETIQHGRLTLRIDRYSAELDEQSLDLSRYEFGMLRVFLGHPGRVYTRDQLMDQVWDEPESASDRTVDAHIKTLRKKLHEVDPSYDPIRTHRGIGYSFETAE